MKVDFFRKKLYIYICVCVCVQREKNGSETHRKRMRKSEIKTESEAAHYNDKSVFLSVFSILIILFYIPVNFISISLYLSL